MSKHQNRQGPEHGSDASELKEALLSNGEGTSGNGGYGISIEKLG
jgi:hypothetical protein